LGCNTAHSCIHRWADWPMPNPAIDANQRPTGWPNPQTYDTRVPGVVMDAVTGLMWQRDLPGDDAAASLTWQEAQDQCARLRLGSYADWRLPSRIELVSIFDTSRAGVLIDGSAFPNATGGAFWTSSTPPSIVNGPLAWLIDFSKGVFSWGDTT